MRTASLLSVVARIHPQVWDVIVDRAPYQSAEVVDHVALNPQPLPPQPPPDALLIGAAHMARAVTRMAVQADLRGESTSEFLGEWIDDWCATPWPRKWPWPWPSPRPDEGPFPEPWMLQTSRIIGAIIIASVGSSLGDTELGAGLIDGAERLADAAMSG